MDREREKLLVVAAGRLAPRLAEYAINVAVRLDLEILVLFLDQQSAPLDGARLKERIAELGTELEDAATEFTTLAWKSSVTVTTIIDVADRETAVDRVRKDDPNIRFIISDDPAQAAAGADGQHPRLEVIRPS